MSTSSIASTSTNLNAMLKQQIKDAVAVIYDEQGTTAANRYSTPEQLSKALLDLLFPKEAEHNTEVTGVVRVPTAAESDSEGSTDSKKERKKRAPMTDEAKAQMKAKREATIAAKKAPAPAPAEPAQAPAPAEQPSDDEAKDKKARKPRGPMTDEAKAQMKAKREATIAAKKAAQA